MHLVGGYAGFLFGAAGTASGAALHGFTDRFDKARQHIYNQCPGQPSVTDDYVADDDFLRTVHTPANAPVNNPTKGPTKAPANRRHLYTPNFEEHSGFTPFDPEKVDWSKLKDIKDLNLL